MEKMTISHETLCEAVEFFLAEKVLKDPLQVKSVALVDQYNAGKGFVIEFGVRCSPPEVSP